MDEIKYLSVSALNRYLAYRFDNDDNLQEVYLKGELSNFKYSGKHCYFSLKDANSEISAMFFYPNNLSLKFQPKDGMNVQVIGRIQVYQKRGTYSIVVKQMLSDGLGLLYQEYLDLKEKLAQEGLFDPEKRLPIPDYPEVVGVITAPTGDAIHDIISTFNRRLPMAKIKLFPALVQGVDAPKDLMRALREVYQDKEVNVLIIGRGGGSFEDLSCFNDEALVRLLAASPIPTVSAIGHEADYTICDFVSSYRAPTPTGAAIALTKEKKDVIELVKTTKMRMRNAMKNGLIHCYNDLQKVVLSYGLAHFDELLNQYQKTLDGYYRHLTLLSPENQMIKITNDLHQYQTRLTNSFNNTLNGFEKRSLFQSHLDKAIIMMFQNREDQVLNLIEKANLLNPFNIMKKGYSILYQDDKIITSVKKIQKNRPFNVKLFDGDISGQIIKITKNEEE